MEFQDFMLPRTLVEQIHKMNVDYISMVMSLADATPAAAPLVGVTDEVISIIAACKMSRLKPLTDTTMLLPRMRITDPQIWRRLAEGKINPDQMLHAFVQTVPVEFLGKSDN